MSPYPTRITVIVEYGDMRPPRSFAITIAEGVASSLAKIPPATKAMDVEHRSAIAKAQVNRGKTVSRLADEIAARLVETIDQ